MNEFDSVTVLDMFSTPRTRLSSHITSFASQVNSVQEIP